MPHRRPTPEKYRRSGGYCLFIYEIAMGEGYGREIYGNTSARDRRCVRDNEKVKSRRAACQLPGGSALASMSFRRNRTPSARAEKPVIARWVYAASGGYYSRPADAIVVDK